MAERARLIVADRIVWCDVERLDGIVTMLPTEALSAQGLYVVTADAKAVLDAAERIPEEWLQDPGALALEELAIMELERRRGRS